MSQVWKFLCSCLIVVFTFPIKFHHLHCNHTLTFRTDICDNKLMSRLRTRNIYLLKCHAHKKGQISIIRCSREPHWVHLKHSLKGAATGTISRGIDAVWSVHHRHNSQKKPSQLWKKLGCFSWNYISNVSWWSGTLKICFLTSFSKLTDPKNSFWSYIHSKVNVNAMSVCLFDV